jgi:hypothetical protein
MSRAGPQVRLVSPRLYHDETRRGIRPVERRMLRAFGVADFMALKAVSAGDPA